MKWAITEEYRGSDPAASHITRNLGKRAPAVNFPSLEHSDVGRALANIRDADAWWAEKYCLLFIALTCVRSGEAREALGARSTWTKPHGRSPQPG